MINNNNLKNISFTKNFQNKIELISKLSTKTSRGVLSKGWYKINGQICIVKGNTESSYEPIAEYIGSRIAYKISDKYSIIYDLMASKLFPEINVFNNFPYVSVCEKWKCNNTQQFSKYVDLLEQKEVKDYKMWLLNKASPKLLYQVSLMLFVDALIGNQDRHLNNWDIIIDTQELAPFIDFGASCLSWNISELKKILNSNSIYPDISKPFAKTHLQQLNTIKKLLNKNHQILKLPNPDIIISDVLTECLWVSEEFPVYYNTVSAYLHRRFNRICKEFQDYLKLC